MRPQKAKMIINTAIKRYFDGDKSAIYKAKPAILCLYKKNISIERNLYGKADERDGESSYGYSSNAIINMNLSYISDRYDCAFRLRWILDGINGKKFKGFSPNQSKFDTIPNNL